MATAAELAVELTAYKACRDSILSGAQSYSIAGRTLTRADLSFLQSHIDTLEARISRKTSGVKTAPVFTTNR